MAEQVIKVNCGFFDSVNSDRLYSAEEMNRPYKRIVSNGVFATPKGTPSTDLQVLSANNGMSIIVKKGEGIFADKWFENPADQIIVVPTNTNIVPRVDSVIVQVDTRQNGRTGNIIYREGTPATNPLPPEIGTVTNVIEYRLANIYVAPTATTINQDSITDLRGSKECPWCTHLLYQVDTSTLYEQWQAAYKKYYDDETEAFNAFMESLTGQLTVNTNIVKYESHYVTTSNNQTVIPINIATFNKNKDVLMVRVNKLFVSEGIDYTISDDNISITLTKDVLANQNIDFLVLQSVVVGDTETVLMEIQKLLTLINTTKATNDLGGVKLSVTGTANVLEAFVNAGTGFHTMYAAYNTTGVPALGAYRLFGQMTAATYGWIIAIKADGSVYENYLDNGTWQGWKSLFEVSPAHLYQSVNGVFPNEGVAITPSKPLSQCQHGWTLVFSGYDDIEKVARDVYVQSVNIPKKSYKNANWTGESLTIPLIYNYANADDSVSICQKTLTVYNDRLVAGSTASTGKQRNMVLRAIYEY